MKYQFKYICALSTLLLLPPNFAKAGLFGSADNGKVATEVAVLDESTMVGTLDFSPDGRYLAVDSHGNGGTDIWELEKKKSLPTCLRAEHTLGTWS